MVTNKIDRSQINRYFYSNFKGIAQCHMRKCAFDWFEIKRLKPDFFYDTDR